MLNQLFRLRINRGRGLVQHENRRVRQNRAGKGNQLLLPGGEAVAALANVRLITILHVADEGFRADHAGSFRHFLVGGIGAAVADIIRDRAGEKVRRLQDVAEVGLKPQLTARAVIRAVDEDFSLRRLIEAADEVDDGGLAAAGFADKGNSLPVLDVQVEVLQHLFALFVAEGDVLKVNVADELGPVFGLGVEIVAVLRHHFGRIHNIGFRFQQADDALRRRLVRIAVPQRCGQYRARAGRS